MSLTDTSRLEFINIIKDKLSKFSEINKIILFGSFLKSDSPNDIDIAIIQNSDDSYLDLSLKYRKVLRELSKLIPLDIVPIKDNTQGVFLDEINKGEIVYEK